MSHLPPGSVPLGARPPPASPCPAPAPPADAGQGAQGPQGERGVWRPSAATTDPAAALAAGLQAQGRGDEGREGARRVGFAPGGGEDEDEDEEEQHDVEVFLGLFFHQGRLGVAVYDEAAAQLSIAQMPDGLNGLDFDGLRTILYQVRPTLVVTAAKLDRAFEDVLKSPGDGFAYNLAFAPSRDFKYEASRARLLQLSLDIFKSNEGRGELTDCDKRQRLASEVDLDAKEAVCAGGGLLQHLLANRLVDDLSDSEVASVTRIKSLQLDKYLHVDLQTLSSLQIFQQDAHPSLAGMGNGKEGLSLFSLLDNTRSPLGRKMLQMWFMRPLLDPAEISHRISSVGFFVDPPHHELVGTLHSYIRCIKDLPRIMLRIRQATASVIDWINLAVSLEALSQIFDACNMYAEAEMTNGPETPEILKKIAAHGMWPKLYLLSDMLKAMIDFETSRTMKRVSIRAGIDEELDQKKDFFEGLGDFLGSVAEEESNDLPDELDFEFFVMFCPQLGYLVTSPRSFEHRLQQRLDSFEVCFSTDEWTYWKTPRMLRLDQEIGDLFAQIADLEFKVATMVREKVLEWHEQILGVTSLAAELDCILSFALAAVDRNFCEPSLVQEPVLYIERGRHPLCELCTDTFIPNNTTLDSGSPDAAGVDIITGANFSGKSVYMKQCALIAYMAHIGSWVPADSCQIGLIDRIFSRVQSRESCAAASSSFAIDLSQVAMMLRSCTGRSLLLIDEFGKGTQPADGISLLGASLRELLKKGTECPRTIVVTHFNELYTIGGILPTDDNISFHTMAVMLDTDPNAEHVNTEDTSHTSPDRASRASSAKAPSEIAPSESGLSRSDEKDEAAQSFGLVFLYQLVEGRSSQSYGYTCASNAGLPSEVVERARIVSAKLRAGEPLERVESEQETSVKRRFEAAVALLQRFDPERGDVRAFMRHIGGLTTRRGV